MDAISSVARGILLDDLVELLDRFVDLLGPGILFVAGSVDLAYQLRGLLDVGHDFGEHLACFFRNFYTRSRKLVDLSCGELASLRKLSYFGRDHGKSLAVLACPGCLNGRVQGEEVGLPGYLFDDGDLAWRSPSWPGPSP